MRLLIKLAGLLVVVLLVLFAALYFRSDLEPLGWEPAPNPGLAGPYAPNNELVAVRLLLEGVGRGPEDIAVAPGGVFYTGFDDGRIVRFTEDGQWSDFADTGGRPLGMQVDHRGNLVVADAYKGLLSIHPDGGIHVLAEGVNGRKMVFPDDLDIAADGTIWFTDASTRFGYAHDIYNFIEARPTGRLLKYDPSRRSVSVAMKGLLFANGVALGPGEEYVLVTETGSGRIHRLWLKGRRAGERDLFHTGLPGYPDNLSFNGTDRYWVALFNPRTADTEALADKPLIRKLVGGLPRSLLPANRHYGFIVALDLDGEVVANLQAPNGEFHQVTSINQAGDKLLIGSFAMEAVGIYSLP
jgi:sugar lactone lactonase YvrE